MSPVVEIPAFDRREVARACQRLHWQMLFLLLSTGQPMPELVPASGAVLPPLSNDQYTGLLIDACDEMLGRRKVDRSLPPIEKFTDRFRVAATLAHVLKHLVPQDVVPDMTKDSLKVDGLTLTPYQWEGDDPRSPRDMVLLLVSDLSMLRLTPYYQLLATELADCIIDRIPDESWSRVPSMFEKPIWQQLRVMLGKVRLMYSPESRDCSFFSIETVTSAIAPYFEAANAVFMEQERRLCLQQGQIWRGPRPEHPYAIRAYKELQIMDEVLQSLLALATDGQ